MTSLHRAAEKVRDGTSLYWSFYHPDDRSEALSLIEVRLNATTELVDGFRTPDGWSLARVQWGDTIFLRRRQILTIETVRDMLLEVLAFAAANDLRFHSWLHDDDAE